MMISAAFIIWVWEQSFVFFLIDVHPLRSEPPVVNIAVSSVIPFKSDSKGCIKPEVRPPDSNT